jgi:hypothetical protein
VLVRKTGLVLVLLTLAAGLFFLLRPGGNAPVVGEGLDDGAGPDAHAPKALHPLDTKPGSVPRTAPGARRDGEADGPSAGEADDQRTETLEVLVVDDEGGKPVEQATVLASVAGRSPCPPLVEEQLFIVVPVAMRFARYAMASATDAQGRCSAKWTKDAADVVVRKKGFIVASACAVTPGVTTTVRLHRGLSIEGIVVGLDDKPVAGARVDANPPRGVAPTPGRREQTMTGEDGLFAIEGLLPGAFDVVVTHDLYMIETRPGVIAGKKGLRIVLRPAFLVTFKITTEDRLPPETPTVGWNVAGAPPWEGVELLHEPVGQHLEPSSPDGSPVPAPGAANDALPTGTFLYEPIRVPAGRPTVMFTVKAIGMELWASPPIDVPGGGGATTIEVPLRRDPDLGHAKIAVESPDHQPLSFATERCRVAIGRRDGKAVDAGVVYKPGDALELPALPSGPYRFTIRSPLHAPVSVDLQVPAGSGVEGLAVLGPPAKLHIKATAPEATVVKLQLRQGREIVWPFVESAKAPTTAPGGGGTADGNPDAAGQDDAGGDEQNVPAGTEGILLTGLASGRVTIEVTSPEWTAPPTSVDLVEGETKELELALTKR